MANIFLYSFGRQFDLPSGVACDHGGNIPVCDTGNNCIKFFNNKSQFMFSFGSEGREEGQFREPIGITCDHDGNILVCDTENHRIQVFKLESKFDSKGKFLFSFGGKGRGEGQFLVPRGITCDHNGNIVVCDTYNHRIQVFDSKGKFLFCFGRQGEEEGQFKWPEGVTCDHNGNIVVSDTWNHRIQVFTNKGEFLFSFGSKGNEEGQLKFPQGVTCDHDGNIIVCDSFNNRVQIFKCEPKAQIDLQSKFKFDTSLMSPSKLTNKGEFIRSFGSKGKEEGQFNCPRGVTCDHDGNYVVADTNNRRIQVFKGPSDVPTLSSLCWKQINLQMI
jgi:tripartite motif-containing protein 71